MKKVLGCSSRLALFMLSCRGFTLPLPLSCALASHEEAFKREHPRDQFRAAGHRRRDGSCNAYAMLGRGRRPVPEACLRPKWPVISALGRVLHEREWDRWVGGGSGAGGGRVGCPQDWVLKHDPWRSSSCRALHAAAFRTCGKDRWETPPASHAVIDSGLERHPASRSRASPGQRIRHPSSRSSVNLRPATPHE